MKYSIQDLVCGGYQENAYLVCPEGTGDCFLIDPGDDLPMLKDAIARAGRMLRGILLTHGHFDHTLAAYPLSVLTGAPVYIHPADESMLCDNDLNAYDETCSVLKSPEEIETEPLGDTLDICGVHFDVLHTPGHTKGSVCFYDAAEGVLFSGDTLFQAGFGRVDFPGGSYREMRDSLRRLFALPDDTRVYCGHGSATTIGTEHARYHI